MPFVKIVQNPMIHCSLCRRCPGTKRLRSVVDVGGYGNSPCACQKSMRFWFIYCVIRFISVSSIHELGGNLDTLMPPLNRDSNSQTCQTRLQGRRSKKRGRGVRVICLSANIIASFCCPPSGGGEGREGGSGEV